jgi:hypothetical protein
MDVDNKTKNWFYDWIWFEVLDFCTRKRKPVGRDYDALLLKIARSLKFKKSELCFILGKLGQEAKDALRQRLVAQNKATASEACDEKSRHSILQWWALGLLNHQPDEHNLEELFEWAYKRASRRKLQVVRRRVNKRV